MKINIEIFNLNKFENTNDEYVYRQDLNESYYCEIKIKDSFLYTKVYDSITKEEYIPFNIKSNTGAHSNHLHELVDQVIESLKIKNNNYEDLKQLIKNKYNIEPDYPFPKDNVSMTFKKPNGKWFMLYMNIPYKSLGVESEERVNVINIKLNSEKILKLIDNVVFYKAYHMNKKYWITINLDNLKSIKDIEELIDESYNLV